MSHNPLHVLVKSSPEKRIEIGGSTAIAEAFLPSTTTSVIRIGGARKSESVRRFRALPPVKLRGSST